MAIGDRIKKARQFRKMTQKELGEKVGLTDVRIRQYELNIRTPKEKVLTDIATALQVNYRALYEPTLYAAEDLMYVMFELDEHYDIKLMETQKEGLGKEYAVIFEEDIIVNSLLKDWYDKKIELKQGKITEAQYYEWKMNWPQSVEE